MTLVFFCLNCDKRFYVYGEDEEHISKLLTLQTDLKRLGYCKNIKVPTAADIIREEAKCCEFPMIYTLTWVFQSLF